MLPLFVNRYLVSLRLDPQLNFLGAATPSGFTEQAMLITCRYAYARRPASSEICPPSPVGCSLIGSNSETSKRFCSAHGNNRKPTCSTFRLLVSLQAISVLIGSPERGREASNGSRFTILSAGYRFTITRLTFASTPSQTWCPASGELRGSHARDSADVSERFPGGRGHRHCPA